MFDRLKQIWISEGNKKISGQGNMCNGEIPADEKQISLTEDGRQKKVMSLTPREHDLYLLLLEGFTLKESAKQLSVKYSTANTHMTGIYKKLNVNSRAELIIKYRDIGGKHE